MSYAAEFRRCMIELDVTAARALWGQVLRHLPAPKSDADMLAKLHIARTASDVVPDGLRQYSHRYCLDSGLPSQLPDDLRPRIADVVGISVTSKYPVVVEAVRGAMEHSVLETYGDGHREPEIVKPRMMAARQRELRGLGLLRR